MSAPASPRSVLDDQFDAFLAWVQQRFAAVTAGAPGQVHLFAIRGSDAKELFSWFLDALPPEARQWHNCSACKSFVRHYGGLVLVDGQGSTVPVLWDPASSPAPYVDAVRALEAAVTGTQIERVFLTQHETWGKAVAGPWPHLALTPLRSLLCKQSVLTTPGRLMAEKQQDYKSLQRGLAEFPLELMRQALALLSTESLYRSEKCIEVARWLVELHEQRQAAPGARARENLTWLAVAKAPPGFCHVRSSMIGTLLEDLQAGLDFAVVKKRFDAKMHPLQYQRPTAAPSAGNIAQAEQIIAKLKAQGSLERRFARLTDIEALWLPAAPPQTSKHKGVFGHLKAAAAAPKQLDVPPIAITWDKFSKTVLPTAEQIEFLVPARPESYVALVTAKNAEAPPIIQWDSEERRNPVTWYMYVNGSQPARWNLRAGEHHPVTAVALGPHRWYGAKHAAHHGEQVVFILQGARDTEYEKSGGFFPEFLKSELRGIRATLEAYAKTAVIAGKDEAQACGICLSKGGKWDHSYRVTAKGGARVVYTLDRWD